MADDRSPVLASLIADHYAPGGRALEAVLAALEEAGVDPESPDPDVLAGLDLLHLGGRRATWAIADLLAGFRARRVLDVGCGLGDAARTFARRVGCEVVGVDPVPALVTAARELSRRTGLDRRTTFRGGSATRLDLPDASFDAVTMLHVGMNLPDKVAAMAELARVLEMGGTLVVYDVMQVGPGHVRFPQPWSPIAAASFVATPSAYRDALAGAGCAVERTTDRIDLARDVLAEAAASPPPVHPGHLLGPGHPTMVANLERALDEGILAPVELLARRLRRASVRLPHAT